MTQDTVICSCAVRMFPQNMYFTDVLLFLKRVLFCKKWIAECNILGAWNIVLDIFILQGSARYNQNFFSKNLFYKRKDVNCFALVKCNINKSVPVVKIDNFTPASLPREAQFFLKFFEVIISTYDLCLSYTNNGQVSMTLFQ